MSGMRTHMNRSVQEVILFILLVCLFVRCSHRTNLSLASSFSFICLFNNFLCKPFITMMWMIAIIWSKIEEENQRKSRQRNSNRRTICWWSYSDGSVSLPTWDSIVIFASKWNKQFFESKIPLFFTWSIFHFKRINQYYWRLTQ